MPFPIPVPGLVVRYAFLWREQWARGLEEGDKDRPCAVVLTSQNQEGDQVVIVVPVTHAAPSDPTLAVEIPAETKRRLGLDDARSWIVVTDANRFVWPGPDLRPRIRGDSSSVAYGALPRALFHRLRDAFADALEARLAGVVKRTE
ncbi:MAG: type II toxin-antitoxin system PemK/MazF family toxin [Caulobacteraceae bacterium]|nr:type II toxin-antitoxin system PemK/MazF family toxin [Caulobacteraceae bacterium]